MLVKRALGGLALPYVVKYRQMVCDKYKLSEMTNGQGNFDTFMSDFAFTGSSDDGNEGNHDSGDDERVIMGMRIYHNF